MDSFNIRNIQLSGLLFAASNPDTPQGILDELACHNSEDVLVRVAANPGVSEATLSMLAQHTLAEVRLAAAENGNLSGKDLELLAADENPDIRYLLAENPLVPETVLSLLIKDENPYVSERAQKTLLRVRGNTSAVEASHEQKSLAAATQNNLLETWQVHGNSWTKISHEMRTSLGAIIGMNELLLSTNLSEEQRNLAQTVQDSAQSLLTMANDIADMSQVSTGIIEQVPFNLIFAVQDSARLLANEAKNSGLRLITYIDQRIPEFVLGDPERFREAISKLLQSNIRLAKKGDILVELVLEEEDTKNINVRFAVKHSDETTKQTTTIQEAGTTQVDTIKLGLATSQQLVEVLGGKLKIENIPGQGLSMWFKLAFQQLAPDSKIPLVATTDVALAPAKPSSNKLALVVEDNPSLQTLAVKQLANLGIQAQAVCNGKKAIDAVKDIAFDLIFMDCHLPEMDGFEATKKIRELEAISGRHTPIIAMTADAMKGDAEKCTAAGMDDYLSKPVSIEQLKQKTELWLPLQRRAHLKA